MLNREECEKACMYLLKHCYETDAPALENGDKDKTYTFTPAGFEESKVFAKLIEEHFNPKSLEFKDIVPGTVLYDKKLNRFIKIIQPVESCAILGHHKAIEFVEMKSDYSARQFWTMKFEANRFYKINIPK